MRLTILGSGTVVPDGSRNSAGYFVEARDVRLMMDCGAGTLHALARYGLPWEQMTHLYISHFHVDHVGELASLFFAFKHGMRSPRSEPLTVIAGQGIDRVMDNLKRSFGDDLFEPEFSVEVRTVSPGESLELAEGSRLTVAKTPHTDESLAARVESRGRSLCYTGDTDYSDDLAMFFSAADLLISECSFRERREGIRHLSIKDVAKLASRAAVKRLLVTHFYFDFDEEKLKQQLQAGFPGEVMIGSDGMRVEINEPV